MFGTVMRARIKPGQREAFTKYLDGYQLRRQPAGFESTQLAWEDRDPDRLLAIVRFRDRESYMANAADPEQDRDYREMIKYLDGEPEWIDVQFAD